MHHLQSLPESRTDANSSRNGIASDLIRVSDVPRLLEDTSVKKAAHVADAYQPASIVEIDDDEVELKFTVTGWEERRVVHTLKHAKGNSMLDSISSTRTATR
jgi:hypothetical protein